MIDKTSTPEPEARPPADADDPAGEMASEASRNAKVWVGAVGIGSAALVAALMYAKRRGK